MLLETLHAYLDDDVNNLWTKFLKSSMTLCKTRGEDMETGYCHRKVYICRI